MATASDHSLPAINGYLKARSEVYDFVIFVENNKSNGNSQSIFLEGVSQASLIIAHTRKKVILLPEPPLRKGTE